jgi:hypothetical protein
LLEQAKEKGQILAEQVEEGIESLTEQAEDLFDQVTDDLPLTRPSSKDQPPSAQPPSSVDPTLWEDEEDELWEFEEPVHSPQSSNKAADNKAADKAINDDDLWGLEEPSTLQQPSPPSVHIPAPRQSSLPLDDDDDEPWI